MSRFPSTRERATFAKRRVKGLHRYVWEVGILRVALPFFCLLAPLDFVTRYGFEIELDPLVSTAVVWIPSSIALGLVASIVHWILMDRDFTATKRSG